MSHNIYYVKHTRTNALASNVAGHCEEPDPPSTKGCAGYNPRRKPAYFREPTPEAA